MLIGFLFGLACGLLATCIVGTYDTVKINDLKFCNLYDDHNYNIK